MVGREINCEWSKLALKLDQNFHIKSVPNQSPFDSTIYFLDKWFKQNPKNATVDNLIVALKAIGQVAIARKIELECASLVRNITQL